jgi:hypothetical protein
MPEGEAVSPYQMALNSVTAHTIKGKDVSGRGAFFSFSFTIHS